MLQVFFASFGFSVTIKILNTCVVTLLWSRVVNSLFATLSGKRGIFTYLLLVLSKGRQFVTKFICNESVGQSQCVPKVCPPFVVDKDQMCFTSF